MSQYSLITERRFGDRSFYLPDRTQPSSQWNPQYLDAGPSYSNYLLPFQPAWVPALEHPSPYSLPPANPAPVFPAPSEYPESSQRTILPPSPHGIPAAPLSPYPFKNDLPRSPTRSPASRAEPRRKSSSLPAYTPTPPAESPTAIKAEPEDHDGCFIMELTTQMGKGKQSFAPPTEVPLRATQASGDMRKLMGVFRLNPFTIHSGDSRGSVSASSQEESTEAHPLEAEPLIFEFQLNMDDDQESPRSLSPGSDSREQLHSFSPGFQLHNVPDEVGQKGEWAEHHPEPGLMVNSAQTPWGLQYPSDAELKCHEDKLLDFTESREYQARIEHRYQTSRELEYFEDSDQYSGPETIHTTCPPSRLHNTISHPYLRKSSYQQQGTTSPPLSSNYVAAVGQMNVHEPHQNINTQWSPGAYIPPSTYTSDSPSCDSAVLPAITNIQTHEQEHAHASRRWSLPEPAGLGINGPFLLQ